MVLGAIVASAAVACSTSADVDGPQDGLDEPGTDLATATVEPGPLVLPTVTPLPPLTPEDRRAAALMTRLFDTRTGVDVDVVQQAVELGHPGLVAPLIELTGFSFDDRTSQVLGDALSRLTGADLGGSFDSQAPWLEWLAGHPEFIPVAGYDRWKGEFYSEIAGGLNSFLYAGVPARIPLWGVQFGGVGKDGIPSLDNPVFTAAEMAAYLDPQERVFGIEVNGEARAYPERIMRVHELSNDVVGGRPVVLVY